MRHPGPRLLLLIFSVLTSAFARQEFSVCGTSADTAAENLFLHRQAVRSRLRAAPSPRALALPAPSANRDAGDIAIIEDTDGVVARQNDFNLDLQSLQFTPTAPSRYRYTVSGQTYDAAAASSGTPLAALDDDDARAITLPFAFPFFGASYTRLFVNSDGNLTFNAADTASTDRSLGRMTAGPPRIAPLFADLDPSLTAGGVRVLSDSTRVVVSWVAVPEYQASGIGTRQTFQVKLYPDGRIEFAYSGVTPASAVVGIAPGSLKGATTLLDFRNDPSADYSAAVAERFGNTLNIDIVTVAQKFYATHEDAYDYLVIYNDLGIPALSGAVAYENTVRSHGTGYGAPTADDGPQYGSPSRLSAVLNLGPLNQYPADPAALVPARTAAGDTPVTIIAHETGHLFLARASVRDPNDPAAQPMLGFQNAHWSFLFNSEASLLEGERILDQGPDANPRFITTGTVEGYAPLDQYLMGFRPPAAVPPTFLVTGAPALAQLHPARGIAFNGGRRDIAIDEIVQVMGRRTPDSTVAQRRFRFAFILVTAAGSQPSGSLAKLDAFRTQFENFFPSAATNNATADTALRRSLKLSLFPAAGVVAGGSATATLTVQTPASSGITVRFLYPAAYTRFPESVTIPPGATTATFTVSGVRPGVEEVTAMPADPAYENAFARVQVAGASQLRIETVSRQNGVVTVRLTDQNGLVYSGAAILATASGGTVSPKTAATGPDGLAAFNWIPGAAPVNQLDLALDGLPSVSLSLQSGSAVTEIASVANAASFETGVAAGAIESILGANLAAGQTAAAPYPWPTTLADVQVLLNGAPLPLLYVSDRQINFYVPAGAALGVGALLVLSPNGTRTAVNVTVNTAQPGIFPGAIVRAGTAASALTTPVHAGDYLEIYCTGLGPTRSVNGLDRTIATPTVFIGATPVQPIYSGLAPGYVGLYQVNVQVPAGLTPGELSVILSVNLAHSNEVRIAVN